VDLAYKALKVCVALVAMIVLSGATRSGGGIESLKRFFDHVTTYGATFQQLILDEGLNPIEESSGTMIIKRPGKFRWDYDPPNRQQVVSDGKKVWFYDIDLEQITVRALDQTVGRTPASLLAGSKDFEKSYIAEDMKITGPLQWVRLKPKQKDTGYEEIRLAFDGSRLRLLELRDGLGQTTRISLTNGNENPDVKDDRFKFVPPPGVDVIDETRRK